MVINEGIIIIALVTFLILIGIFFIRYFTGPSLEQFRIFISYLGGISVLLITYNIYLNIRSNEKIEKNRMAYNTLEVTNRQWLAPQKDAVEFYPESFFLFASMNPVVELSDHTPKEWDPIKRHLVETYFANRIYQVLEDFLSIGVHDLTGVPVWLGIFLMWFQSDILHELWPKYAHCYSRDTQVLVKQVTEKANELKELSKKTGRKLTTKDYEDVAYTMEVALR